MSTFAVKVLRVVTIEPIAGADSIELVVVGDYRSVVRKGQFHAGDLAVYIPEASIVPLPLLQSMGLEGRLAGKDKNRVKAVRLRGVVSQGVLYPLVLSGDGGSLLQTHTIPLTLLPVYDDQDVADVLGITKYEPPIPVCMSGEVYNAGQHITVAYDIENYKTFPVILKDGEGVVMTEKIHGCLAASTKVMLPNGEEIPIEDVINNETITSVLSFDVNTQTYVTKKITGKMKRPNKENKRWIRLTFDGGRTLVMTEDHPVYSRDRKQFVNAKDIIENEDIESFIDPP